MASMACFAHIEPMFTTAPGRRCFTRSAANRWVRKNSPRLTSRYRRRSEEEGRGEGGGCFPEPEGKRHQHRHGHRQRQPVDPTPSRGELVTEDQVENEEPAVGEGEEIARRQTGKPDLGENTGPGGGEPEGGEVPGGPHSNCGQPDGTEEFDCRHRPEGDAGDCLVEGAVHEPEDGSQEEHGSPLTAREATNRLPGPPPEEEDERGGGDAKPGHCRWSKAREQQHREGRAEIPRHRAEDEVGVRWHALDCCLHPRGNTSVLGSRHWRDRQQMSERSFGSKAKRPVRLRSSEAALDAPNLDILRHLQADPRLPVSELARRVGMSAPAVKEHGRAGPGPRSVPRARTDDHLHRPVDARATAGAPVAGPAGLQESEALAPEVGQERPGDLLGPLAPLGEKTPDEGAL